RITASELPLRRPSSSSVALGQALTTSSARSPLEFTRAKIPARKASEIQRAALKAVRSDIAQPRSGIRTPPACTVFFNFQLPAPAPGTSELCKILRLVRNHELCHSRAATMDLPRPPEPTAPGTRLSGPRWSGRRAT